MPSPIGTYNYVERFSNLETSMAAVDEQIRNRVNDNIRRVAEQLQSNALKRKEITIQQKQTFLGAYLNTYA